ncbi:MAG: hypothetical protein PHR87_03665 [Sulfurospirillaceae bacterium]|nr:hypothetical protein [Sulfurospirillaceae bacterium]
MTQALKITLTKLGLKLIFAFGLFAIPFMAFYPDPIFFDLSSGFRCSAGDGYFGFGTVQSNIFIALILFALFIVIMMAISVYLSHKFETMLLKPKNQYVQGFFILVLFFGGLTSGFMFNVAMGVTDYASCLDKSSNKTILEKNWRQEIRAYTGFDSLLGVDLKIKR